MKYCPHCGAPATGAPFCGNCGQRLDATPVETSEKAPGASAPSASTPEGSLAGAQRSPRTGTTPQANPFAGIAVADYIRDIVALLLLLVSLGLPWDFSDDVTGKVYVVLATLLSVASLALPYLSKAGVFPPSFGPDLLRLTRLLANVPYVAVVVLAVLFNYLDVFDASGIGVGAVFGLAGAMLAAQPRTTELVAADGQLWRNVAYALGAVTVVATLVNVLHVLVNFSDEWEVDVHLILFYVELLAIIGLALYGVFRRDASWRYALVVLGASALLFGFWQLASDTVSDTWRLLGESAVGVWQAVGFGLAMLLWPSIAVAVTALGVAGLVDKVPASDLRPWVGAVERVLELTVVVALFGVAFMALQLSLFESDRGGRISAIVIYLIIVAAGLVARSALRRDAAQGRPVALIVAGVLAVLGIVLAALLPNVGFVEAATLSMLLMFAAAIAVLLTVPRPVREQLAVVPMTLPGRSGNISARPAAASGPSADAEQAETTQFDAAAGAAASAAAGDAAGQAASGRPAYTAQVASDPSTPHEVLADIAATEPSLWPYVAANPSTYQELLDWLANLGEPAVDEALRGRSES
jgi:hypothetical protein